MHARLLLCLVLPACTGDSETVVERQGCEEVVASERVGAEEQTALGTAEAWAAQARALAPATLRYRMTPDGPSTTSELRIQLVLDSTDARLVRRRDAVNTQATCPELMELPATLALQSDDGSFDETFRATARVESSQLSFRGVQALAGVSGSFRRNGFPAAFDALHVQLFVTGHASTGSLMLEAPAPRNLTSADVGEW